MNHSQFLKEALALPLFSFTFTKNAIVKIAFIAFFGLLRMQAVPQHYSTDAAISVGELRDSKTQERMISVLANNYVIVRQAHNLWDSSRPGNILRKLQGPDAINELNKRMGVSGISEQGINELLDIFHQQLFEALVERLVVNSSDGFTAKDFDRVNNEIAPYKIKLQDFGIRRPKKLKNTNVEEIDLDHAA